MKYVLIGVYLFGALFITGWMTICDMLSGQKRTWSEFFIDTIEAIFAGIVWPLTAWMIIKGIATRR